jgi:hypothetical protein
VKRQATEAIGDVGDQFECTCPGERELTGMLKRRRRSRPIGARPIDLQNGVDHLARAIKQIEISLQRAEQETATEARDRLPQLRRETREQLLVLRGYEREAMRILIRLSRAPKGSWSDLERAADRALQEACRIADAIIERCRRILSA